ncbi:MAG: tRNA uridine-5-carboxymethylaminomethyl(34) synthesis GTPase MnmE [Pseudomonadota bacterium]
MDTIFSLSSGALPSGVAVVRISGPQARDVFQLFSADAPDVRQASLISLLDPETGDTLDRCLALLFVGPASFTGEDVVELQLHGSRAVVSRVLSVLASQPGCRPAVAGEFTRQAFENGKMDLTAVEGLGDLLTAETEQQRRYAVEQSDGRLGNALEVLRNDVLQVLAVLEASLEFADEEDVPEDGLSVISEPLRDLAQSFDEILQTFNTGRIIRDGYRVALIGRPNVGKSSLLNALSGSDRAIVTDEEGTTRDLIEVELDVDGFLVRLSDTAGIRDADGIAEKEGIRRSLLASQSADLVLLLSCADIPEVEIEHPNVLRVLTKADLVEPHTREQATPDVRVSSTTLEGVRDVLSVISENLQRVPTVEGALINRERHRASLTEARDALEKSSQLGLEHDIRAEHLRMCAQAVGRLTGRVDPEEILDRVFQGFCIGK